jgi:sugar lactone lactonase YvrE
VARDPAFSQLLVHQSTGGLTEYKVTEKEWYARLGDASENQVVTLYHRVISTDGKHVTTGPALPLKLRKNDAPLTDFVEVPAPNFVYKGRIATGAGYGATWDKYGKLWLCNYSGALCVKNPDNTFATYTRLKFGATQVMLSTLTGISTDGQGDILLTRGTTLYRIDPKTVEIMAAWTSPVSLSMARVNDQGQVYAAGLLNNTAVYVLERDPADGSKYKLVKTITLPAGRLLSRTFAMTPDGKTFYFSDPGNPAIQQYGSTDGTTFTLSKVISTVASGTSGLQLDANGALYTATKGSGVLPATFSFRDEAAKKLWTLPLPDLGQSEARGLGLSPKGDSLIFCSWTVNTGFHLYVRQEGAESPPVVKNIPTYKIAQVRGVDGNGTADSLGVYCAVEGVVQSINYSESGLSFFIHDGGAALQVYRQAGRAGYSPKRGDILRVVGRLGQESGQLRLQTDSLRQLATGGALQKPVAVTAPGEANESSIVRLENLKLTDKGQWTTGMGYLGYWVEVADSLRTYRLFIDRQTDLYNLPFPKGRFNATGFVVQYDPEHPHLGGYEVWPGGQSDLFVHPVLALNLNPTCSQNPAVTRRWRVQNPNRFAVDVRWVVKGTAHGGTFAAPPGESFFTTQAVAGTHVVALEWFDQYGTVQRKEKAASTEACSGRTGSTVRAEDDLLFPNPTRDKAVLRLTYPAGTPVDLVLTHQGSGRVVWKKARVRYPADGVSIAVGHLPAGLYLLTVTAGGQPQTIRLYKE